MSNYLIDIVMESLKEIDVCNGKIIVTDSQIELLKDRVDTEYVYNIKNAFGANDDLIKRNIYRWLRFKQYEMGIRFIYNKDEKVIDKEELILRYAICNIAAKNLGVSRTDIMAVLYKVHIDECAEMSEELKIEIGKQRIREDRKDSAIVE